MTAVPVVVAVPFRPPAHHRQPLVSSLRFPRDEAAAAAV